jgi:CheY-like chemotaxis protein
VVDDEEIIQKTLGSILKRMGYRVLAATNTGQANELFIQHAPELLGGHPKPAIEGHFKTGQR